MMDLSELESALADLIARCDALAASNRELRERERELLAEREALLARQQAAQAKFDSVIGRASGASEG